MRKTLGILVCGAGLMVLAACGGESVLPDERVQTGALVQETAAAETESRQPETGQPETESRQTETGAISEETVPAQEDEFVDHLTENGEGIAINREPTVAMKEWGQSQYFALDEKGADLRWYSCDNLMEEEMATLKKAIPDVTFNEDTVFTEEIEKVLQPEILLEKGKNPGLGVRALHEQGITGNGVGIAIIDSPLYAGHPEYTSRLKLYEEIHVSEKEGAAQHGASLASLSVGKSCGVAPEADLYFWGVNNQKIFDFEYTDDNDAIEWSVYTRAIERIMEVNRTLPEEHKIRVIGIAKGYALEGCSETKQQIREMLDVIKEAEKEGIFVVTTSTALNYDFFSKFRTRVPFAGLGKVDPAGDADDVDNYTLGEWQWENPDRLSNALLVPMDDRTIADASGDTYVFWVNGGWSWTVPYIAGMYALCAQVEPEITPEKFYAAAWETSTEIERQRYSHSPMHTFHVLNPQALIAYLQEE